MRATETEVNGLMTVLTMKKGDNMTPDMTMRGWA